MNPYLFAAILGEVALFFHYLFGQIYQVDTIANAQWLPPIGVGLGWALTIVVIKILIGLRTLLPSIIEMSNQEFEEVFLEAVLKATSTKQLLLWGCLFGTLNVLLSVSAGVPFDQTPLIASLMFQHFACAFFCGTITWVITVTSGLLREVARRGLVIDVYAHDKCGGTGFVGKVALLNALIAFFGGVMYCSYVYFNYVVIQTDLAVKTALIVFMLIPHSVAIAAFFMPVLGFNEQLRSKKMDAASKLALEYRANQKLIAESMGKVKEIANQESDRIRNKLEFIQDLRTWPYDTRRMIEFFTALVIPIIIILIERFSTSLNFL